MMETAASALLAPLAPGLQITPSVRLVRELGRGGMGSVWIADHASLRSQVAVKFLAERSLSMPDAVERFSLEAAAAARVRSPHVVQVFDHGVAHGTPYIVMELLEGEDLARRLEREGRLSFADTIAVIGQMCKALERAHALGIVHRDVKPANVFLVSGLGDGLFVKVLDFGLAKHGGALGDLTTSRAVFGTPHYVSPEQAGSARTVTPQADLWSVAVVAYECLTGKRPYDAESLIDLCAALSESRFAPPTSVRPELPPAIDAWFRRAFERRPSDRFASATELASTLATVLTEPLGPIAPVAPIAPVEEALPAPVETRAAHSRAPGRRWPGARARAALSWIAIVAGAAAAALFFSPRLAQPPAPATQSSAVVIATSAPTPIALPPGDPPPATIAAAPSTPPVVASSAAPPSIAPLRAPPRAALRPTAPPASATPPRPSGEDLFTDPKR